MENTTLSIKNMVCSRCIWAVQRELKKQGLKPLKVILGTAIVEGQVDDETVRKIDLSLHHIGFELIDDKKSRLIENIRTEVINYIHYDPELLGKRNFSDYLSKKLGYDYSYLSSLFSSVEGITIEKYIILQRIEKVKELLVYDELTLSEISYRTGYSSVQHLSNQFKKTIGMSPSMFKRLQENNRKPLDKV
ncbi:MAG: helix-turn-helix domain-containing protein [Bacteroidales bacterium]|nr:helix-turn-helix domain-containing protein [Bacteroidales bacterium]